MQYNRTVGCVDIHIDTKRIDENLKRAQDLLDGRVLNDMKEYIPMDQQKALSVVQQIKDVFDSHFILEYLKDVFRHQSVCFMPLWQIIY